MSSCWVATRPCRGTRVKYLVSGSFSSNDATEVVLCQEWSLELLALQKTTGTLARAIQQDVPSRIRAIDKYGCAGHQEALTQGRDALVMACDSGKLSVLQYSTELRRFVALQHIMVASRPGRHPQQLGACLSVHPDGHAVAIAALHDKIAVYPAAAQPGTPGAILSDRFTPWAASASAASDGAGAGAEASAPDAAAAQQADAGAADQRPEAMEDSQAITVASSPQARQPGQQPSWSPGGGSRQRRATLIRALVFLNSPSPAGAAATGRPPPLHLAVLTEGLQEADDASSEVQVLQYEHATQEGQEAAIRCLRRIKLPHSGSGIASLAGRPLHLLALPSKAMGLMVLGSVATAALDCSQAHVPAAAPPAALALGGMVTSWSGGPGIVMLVPAAAAASAAADGGDSAPVAALPAPGCVNLIGGSCQQLPVGTAPAAPAAGVWLPAVWHAGSSYGSPAAVGDATVCSAVGGALDVDGTDAAMEEAGTLTSQDSVVSWAWFHGGCLVPAQQQQQQQAQQQEAQQVDTLFMSTSSGGVHILCLPGSSGTVQDVQAVLPQLHAHAYAAAAPVQALAALPDGRGGCLLLAAPLGAPLQALRPVAIPHAGRPTALELREDASVTKDLDLPGRGQGEVVDAFVSQPQASTSGRPCIYTACRVGNPAGDAGGSACVRVLDAGCCPAEPVPLETPDTCGAMPTALWRVPGRLADAHHALLVISFLGASRALLLTAGECFEDATEQVDLAEGLPTVACGLLADHVMAQVTPSGVRLCLLEAALESAAAAPLSQAQQPYTRRCRRSSESSSGSGEGESSTATATAVAAAAAAAASAGRCSPGVSSGLMAALDHGLRLASSLEDASMMDSQCDSEAHMAAVPGAADSAAAPLQPPCGASPIRAGPSSHPASCSGGRFMAAGDAASPSLGSGWQLPDDELAAGATILLAAVAPGCIALCTSRSRAVQLLRLQPAATTPTSSADTAGNSNGLPQCTTTPPAASRKRSRQHLHLLPVARLEVGCDVSCLALTPWPPSEAALDLSAAPAYLLAVGDHSPSTAIYHVTSSHGGAGPPSSLARVSLAAAQPGAPAAQICRQLCRLPALPPSPRLQPLEEANGPDAMPPAAAFSSPSASTSSSSFFAAAAAAMCTGPMPPECVLWLPRLSADAAQAHFLIGYRNGRLALHSCSPAAGACTLLWVSSLGTLPLQLTLLPTAAEAEAIAAAGVLPQWQPGSRAGQAAAAAAPLHASGAPSLRALALGDRAYVLEVSPVNQRVTWKALSQQGVRCATSLVLQRPPSTPPTTPPSMLQLVPHNQQEGGHGALQPLLLCVTDACKWVLLQPPSEAAMAQGAAPSRELFCLPHHTPHRLLPWPRTQGLPSLLVLMTSRALSEQTRVFCLTSIEEATGAEDASMILASNEAVNAMCTWQPGPAAAAAAAAAGPAEGGRERPVVFVPPGDIELVNWLFSLGGSVPGPSPRPRSQGAAAARRGPLLVLGNSIRDAGEWKGSLLVLALSTDTPIGSRPARRLWGRVTQMRMPSAVTAVVEHQGHIVVAVGHRLASYQLAGGCRLQRLCSVVTHSPVLHLAACASSTMLAAADSAGVVSLYDWPHGRRQQLVIADTVPRALVGLALLAGPDDHDAPIGPGGAPAKRLPMVAVVDAGGYFLLLKQPAGGAQGSIANGAAAPHRFPLPIQQNLELAGVYHFGEAPAAMSTYCASVGGSTLSSSDGSSCGANQPGSHDRCQQQQQQQQGCHVWAICQDGGAHVLSSVPHWAPLAADAALQAAHATLPACPLLAPLSGAPHAHCRSTYRNHQVQQQAGDACGATTVLDGSLLDAWLSLPRPAQLEAITAALAASHLGGVSGSVKAEGNYGAAAAAGESTEQGGAEALSPSSLHALLEPGAGQGVSGPADAVAALASHAQECLELWQQY